MKKKILINASMYSENPPGVGIHTREVYNMLSKLLSKNNIDYSCYTYSKKGLNYPEALKIIKLPVFFEFLFKHFVSLHRVLWNIFYLPLISKKYDLVYSIATYGSPFIKNQIITIHDLICFKYPNQNKFQYLYFKFVLPYIIRSCKKIIVISEFTKNDVIEKYKVSADKLEVIYCGHDHLNNPQISPQKSDIRMLENVTGDKPFFFTAGASYPHKNVDKIISAMQALPEYNLIITGPKNAYYKQLREITEKKKQGNIIFMNYVSDSFLKLLYKRCTANIYISSYEGFGSTPLEAAMNDKVSIVSNETALPEVYGNSVFYVSPDNTNEIKDALLSVTSSQFNAAVYKNQFPDLIIKYSWANTANGILKVILAVLNNGKNKQD